MVSNVRNKLIDYSNLPDASSLKVPSPCPSKPCQNGATCQEAPASYLCRCVSAVASSSEVQCEKPNDLCHPTPCQGNTSCRSSPGTSGELMCQCQLGSSEGSCEARVQRCARSLCGDEAQCDIQAPPGGNPGYSCACTEGYTGPRCETLVNQCASNPCRNRAICRVKADGYSCYCVPGFQGKNCEIEVNECVSQPCQNGATCINKIGRYACLCKEGYTGDCELQIDECQSQPCLNGASCHDVVNGFSCTCAPGFRGEFCEINIDECQTQPCQNGAVCTDGVNSYSCDCSQSGFTGANCEIPTPPCTSRPCANGGLCQESRGNYTCECRPGYQGRHCEVDVGECRSSPCLAGGRCIERSWKALYGREPLLPESFDPRRAAGFVCKCAPGLKGALCEEDIDECDLQPCQNGGMCVNSHGGYTCHCSQERRDGLLFGGDNCTEVLVGCDAHECQNGGACFPFLGAEQHGYSCSCPRGFTGSKCQTSTTFSFETSGYLRLESLAVGAEISFNIALTFKTALTDALLFQHGNGDVLAGLQLVDSRLHLALWRDGVLSAALELPHNVTDAEWHSAEALLAGGTLEVRIADSSCYEYCGRKALVGSNWTDLDDGFQSTFVGAPGSDTWPAGAPPPHFVGCLRDVFVDSQLVVPENWLSDFAVNVTAGCSDEDRCEGDPCQARGRCLNLWQSHRCECRRPYEGQDCSEEYIAARFGNEDSESYAVFSVDDSPGPRNVISVFIRTRKPSGLLLALSNSTSPYLTIWLEEAKVKVQVNGSGTLEGEQIVTDGNFHLVTVKVEENQVTLFEPAHKQGVSILVENMRVEPGDRVHVGGLADRHASARFGGYFKGCIQDVRLNSKRLQLYPIAAPVSSYALDAMVNVSRGCPGDDACQKKPCRNGGTCHPAWDDFECACPPNTSGELCEEVEWCALSPCPPAAVCQPLDRGFECVSNATFRDSNSVVSYRSNGKISRKLTSVSFGIRTRKRNAAVLHAEKGPEFLTVSVQDSHLYLELLSGSGPLALSVRGPGAVSDGEWHSVELSMAAPSSHASRWTVSVDREASTSSAAAGNLDFLKDDGVDILLGGLGPGAVGNLAGCLSTVDIGGIALPHYGSGELTVPRPQEEQFIKTSTEPVASGCAGPGVCLPGPCLNGGTCRDLFDVFACTCPPGWTGQRCEASADACRSDPCVHGNCTSRWPGYKCACDAGYAGTDCEAEADRCEDHKCANGATCLQGVKRYSCLCPEDYYGPYCTEQVEEVPWYIVKIQRPRLPVSVCGYERKNYTCFNGGNCSETPMMCDCLPGFVGDRCEVEINECISNPCLNGGYCRNLINKFHCNCPLSFAGEVCQIDLNADNLTTELLLSACLVSAALFLSIVVASAALAVAAKRRATRGTYSPSRQEKEGSRVEMWNMVQPPPTERLI
uniref:Crumbs cell polarity complex component 1 n=1 Tax=Scleropages formosus TaxID=113540 RepID=A0A8C9R5K7_SCLFO